MSRFSTLLFSVLLLACENGKVMVEPSAEVGVFFGGQMQRARRVEIPTVRPPNIGFRVQIPPGVASELRGKTIEYEIVKPGPSGRRVTKKGELKVPEGQNQVDHVLSLSPPRKLGVWNVRVTMGERLLADRALYLVSPLAASP